MYTEIRSLVQHLLHAGVTLLPQRDRLDVSCNDAVDGTGPRAPRVA